MLPHHHPKHPTPDRLGRFTVANRIPQKTADRLAASPEAQRLLMREEPPLRCLRMEGQDEGFTCLKRGGGVNWLTLSDF